MWPEPKEQIAERMKAAGIDITSVQFAALTVLHEKPGIDQATLAQEIAYDRATIGGVVDRLERKGWVLRKVNQDDRRARQVTLTEEGTAMLAVVAPIVATLQADILAQLTLTERTAFIALASKAAAN